MSSATLAKLELFQMELMQLCEEYYIFDAVIVAIMQMPSCDLVENIKTQKSQGALDTITTRIIDCITYYDIDKCDARPVLNAFNIAIADIDDTLQITEEMIYSN